MLLDSPPSATNCHTFSDSLPLERDVLYGRPLRSSARGLPRLTILEEYRQHTRRIYGCILSMQLFSREAEASSTCRPKA